MALTVGSTSSGSNPPEWYPPSPGSVPGWGPKSIPPRQADHSDAEHGAVLAQPETDHPWMPTSLEPVRSGVGLACASLVSGILWLGGIGSALGLVFGYLGMRRANEDPIHEGRGVCTAGIAISGVGVLASLVMLMGAAQFYVVNALTREDVAAQAALASDLRNAATAQEAYFTMYGQYAQDMPSLEDMGYYSFMATDPVRVAWADESGYCMEGETDSGTTMSYSSLNPSVRKGPC